MSHDYDGNLYAVEPPEPAPFPDPRDAETGTDRPRLAAYRAPKVWRANELRDAEQPRWLANGRLPYAAISVLVGDEGIGKSLLWVWLAAAITTGCELPGFGVPARDPADVLLVITEDDWSTTVRPRLEVAGADLDRVSVICTDDDGSGAPTFSQSQNMHLIIEADPAPALIVVDAWLDTVPGGLSVRDPQQARQALHPWREAATATSAAVLLLTHTNRIQSGDARSKVGATVALRQKARMMLLAQRDESGALLVGPDKSNISGPKPASRFTIEPVGRFAATDDHDGTVPVLRYSGDSALTAGEHLAEMFERNQDGESNEVDSWLIAYLTGEGGCDLSNSVKAAAEAAGFKWDQAKRAKKRLGVTSERREGRWFWSVPEASTAPNPLPTDSDAPPTAEKGSATPPVFRSDTPLLPSWSEGGKGSGVGDVREQGSKGTETHP